MTGPGVPAPQPAATDPGWDAVLLAGFGGPERTEDVMPFLRNVTRGRGVPEERLVEVSHHYEALGGSSPINAQNRALQEALAAELARRGIDLPVLWGNRNWGPYLTDVVRQAHWDGLPRLLGLATSAYSSYSSCRQYREDFAAALESNELVGRVRIDKLRLYWNHPGFLLPFTDGIAGAVADAEAAGIAPDEIQVLFTTHSVPTSMAESSGPTGTPPPGAYVSQHLMACAAVIRALPDGPLRWRLVYQSRSGSPDNPWLEPDINEVIAGLAGTRWRGVIVVPIGFVSDHVEVIWDLDNEARESAAEAGLFFARVATPGTDPRFVAALADLVQERLEPAASSAVLTGTVAPDFCGAGCCPNPRRPRPTTSSVDSAADWAGSDVDPAALAASGIGGSAGATGAS